MYWLSFCLNSAISSMNGIIGSLKNEPYNIYFRIVIFFVLFSEGKLNFFDTY